MLVTTREKTLGPHRKQCQQQNPIAKSAAHSETTQKPTANGTKMLPREGRSSVTQQPRL
jgi:hypothetical protein